MLAAKNLIIEMNNTKLFEIENLTINKSESINIIGNNRTGKTVLLKTLKGEFKDFTGELEYTNYPLKKTKIIEIGIVPCLLDDYSVEYNIALPLKKYSEQTKNRVLNFCKSYKLENFLERKVKTLSFSEKKIVELIRAVIQFPHMILIDDFHTFFDELNTEKIAGMIEYARNGGTTVIAFTTEKIGYFAQHLYINAQSKKLERRF